MHFRRWINLCWGNIRESDDRATNSFNCCSDAKSGLTLCSPRNRSTPGFPVLCLLEFAQTHVYWVRDAIQPSHPLPPPFFSCPQSFPALGSFPESRLFTLSGQSIHLILLKIWANFFMSNVNLQRMREKSHFNDYLFNFSFARVPSRHRWGDLAFLQCHVGEKEKWCASQAQGNSCWAQKLDRRFWKTPPIANEF